MRTHHRRTRAIIKTREKRSCGALSLFDQQKAQYVVFVFSSACLVQQSVLRYGFFVIFLFLLSVKSVKKPNPCPKHLRACTQL